MIELKCPYSKIIKVNLNVPSMASPNFYAINIKTEKIFAKDYTMKSLVDKIKKSKQKPKDFLICEYKDGKIYVHFKSTLKALEQINNSNKGE